LDLGLRAVVAHWSGREFAAAIVAGYKRAYRPASVNAWGETHTNALIGKRRRAEVLAVIASGRIHVGSSVLCRGAAGWAGGFFQFRIVSCAAASLAAVDRFRKSAVASLTSAGFGSCLAGINRFARGSFCIVVAFRS